MTFTQEQDVSLAHMRDMLRTRMKDKPRRFEHSLGVTETAINLAEVYGVDTYDAAVAGLLHDWDKVVDDHDLLARAAQFGIEIAGSPVAAVGLLHGPVAACELPHIFPDLSPEVLQAIARHTIGASDMSALDMVVFIADAIEPHRHGSYADGLRVLVGEASLTELFFQTFSQGLVYVISGGRYLYPTAVGIYNAYAQINSR